MGGCDQNPSSTAMTDIDQLTAFHKKLVTIESPLDAAYDQYDVAFKKAYQDGDIYSLYDVTKAFHDSAETAMTASQDLDVPSFQNHNVSKDAQFIHDNFQNYIASLIDMSENIMSAVNSGGLTPEMNDKIKQDHDNANTYLLLFTAKVISAYSALGYNADQIDDKNGGLLSQASQDTPATQ